MTNYHPNHEWQIANEARRLMSQLGLYGYRETLRRFEKLILTLAIEQSQGNCSMAARRLGLPPSTLSSRLKSLGLENQR